MKKSLLLLCLAAACSVAFADRPIKVKVVGTDGRGSVASASLAVEYPDTILRLDADPKGRLAFSPRMYPMTITAEAKGWLPSTVGLVGRPKKTVSILMDPDPASPCQPSRRRPDWSSDRPRRLSSVYIVRSSLKTRE